MPPVDSLAASDIIGGFSFDPHMSLSLIAHALCFASFLTLHSSLSMCLVLFSSGTSFVQCWFLRVSMSKHSSSLPEADSSVLCPVLLTAPFDEFIRHSHQVRPSLGISASAFVHMVWFELNLRSACSDCRGHFQFHRHSQVDDHRRSSITDFHRVTRR